MKEITIDNLDSSTRQEVFDFIATHLLTQKEKSTNKQGRILDHNPYTECRYRGPRGLKCAAGCIIPDEYYDRDIEGSIWSRVVDFSGFSNNHETLILVLQKIHDTIHVQHWPLHLKKLALSQKLIWNENLELLSKDPIFHSEKLV